MSDPAFLAGETLPADKIQALGTDDVWTPTLTASSANPALGTGAVTTGEVHFNGLMYFAVFNITAGTAGTTSGTGTYQIDLPAALTIDAAWAANIAVGVAELNDSGTAVPLMLRTTSSTRIVARHIGHGTHGDANWASTTLPIGINDFIRGSFHALLA